MKIALDPHMHRHLNLRDLCRKTADLGFDYIELSPRDDFLPWWVRPRAHKERIAEFKAALKDHGVQLASILPMYRWASPHEDERQAAVRYWKEAIVIAAEMGCDTMNSEFGRGPSPDRAMQLSRGNVAVISGDSLRAEINTWDPTGQSLFGDKAQAPAATHRHWVLWTAFVAVLAAAAAYGVWFWRRRAVSGGVR